MRGPLVTISIPTFKSHKTLALCLGSIKRQSYGNIEVNIICGAQKNKIQEIAKDFGIKQIKFYNGSLLQSRYEGVKLAKGKYILILDSDQILNSTSIERAVKLAETKLIDMLAFDETVYRKKTFIEKLFYFDRKLINTIEDLSPFSGVIMPRFFNTKLLKKAYSHIPTTYFAHTGGPDHAIVYYEAWLISKKIAILKNAVQHIEPDSLMIIWKKFYRWGYTSIDAHSGKYHNLMVQKERFRTGLFTRGLFIESLGSILLLIIKGVPFKLGFIIAKYQKLIGRKT